MQQIRSREELRDPCRSLFWPAVSVLDPPCLFLPPVPVKAAAAGRRRTGVCMTKELFVSSTPHETRVGLVEDDQLAEIYLERENEYTLAGSIYKGRVTRVLPC